MSGKVTRAARLALRGQRTASNLSLVESDHMTRILASDWSLQCQRAASSLSAVDQALPFSAIPGPPSWPLIGHLHLLSSKETVLGMDKFQTSLMEQFGDIVRLQVLGSLICNVYQIILIGSALKLIFE